MQTTTSPKIRKAFEKFHDENPEVFRLFKKFTFQAIAKGHKQYSADAIMHRVRWETSIITNDTRYKINNNHISYYARKFADEFPVLRFFFRFRALRGA